MTGYERDPILDRLREADPARTGDVDESVVRANVKRRGEQALGSQRPRRPRRAGLLIAAAGGLAAAALAIVLVGGGDGLPSGPERALAIENGPNGVTLTIEDSDATADEMNKELEAAGIDRVRVFSVPGSSNHAGTWAGQIELGANCEGGPSRFGFGIRIPYHVIDAPPAPGRDFIDLELPRGGRRPDQVVGATLIVGRGSGKRAVVSARDDDTSTYAPAILIAIRSRVPGDGVEEKTFDIDDLAALGGVFSPYAQALADGRTSCEELGLKPPAPPSLSERAAGRLFRGGPVMGRCVVKVLGGGVLSIDGPVSAQDARRIHSCSRKLARAARHEHAQLRSRRESEFEPIDSVADLPAFVRGRLDSTQAAPHGGVVPSKRGIDTGKVVLTDHDGHDHRLSPKRTGEYVNLLCAARGGQDHEFFATTFFEGKPIANAQVSCRAHGPWRSTHVVRVGELGAYEIHLNGAGFDDFVIHTRVIAKPSRAPSHRRGPH